MNRYVISAVLAAGLIVLPVASRADEIQLVGTRENVRLTVADIQAAMKQLSPQQIEAIATDARTRDSFAADVLLRRVMAEEARRQGTDKLPQIADRLQIMIDRALSDMHLETVENAAIDLVKLEKLAQDEYQAYPERYRNESVHVRHILIEKHPSCQNEPAKQAEELANRVKAGESFEELARQYSDDAASAAKGGDLGWVARGRMVKPFEEAMFALKKPGDLSSPTMTKFGIHLIQLVERKDEALRPFEEVKDAIIEKLRLAQRQEMRNALMATLRDPAKFQIDSAAVQKAVEGFKDLNNAPK